MGESSVSWARFLRRTALAQAMVVVALFSRAFFAGNQLVGARLSDLHTYYYCQRVFGFRQILHGHFPFWNPYSYSGTPFFANPSAAMLYPINYLHLLLNPATAINLIIALHVFLAGFFTAIYLRNRAHSALAAIGGGICFSLSAGVILRIYAGHLAHLCTIAYAPLIFFCVDRLLERPNRRTMVLLSVAAALQGLAGQPQIAYYTGLVVLLYAGVAILTARPQAAWSGIRAIVVGYLLAMTLIAVQLFPEIHVALASVRGSGTSLQFSSTDPVPPENFLELLVPGIFGNEATSPYVGRYLPAEVRIYCGCAVLVLAILGAMRRGYDRKIALPMCAICIIISLGVQTPVYGFLFHWLPGFALFRESGRIHYVTNLFIVLLFANGIDSLQEDRAPGASTVLAVTAGVIWVLAVFLFIESNRGNAGLWGNFVRAAGLPGNIAVSTAHFAAAQAMWAAGGISMLLLVLLVFPRFAACASVAIAIAELLRIGMVYCQVSPALMNYPPEWAAAERQLVNDQRVLTDDLPWANYSMLRRTNDALGYDPIALARYGRFLYAMQGLSPRTNYISPMQRLSPLLRILRCRFVLLTDGQKHPVIAVKNPLPHVLLIGDAVVEADARAAFAAMNSPGFDPTRQVVLQASPAIAPMDSEAPGSVRIVAQTPDSLEIEADTPQRAIILITDSYDTGWHAKALPGSSQQHYDLILADCTLRGVPVKKGHHHFQISYTPPGLYAGAIISGLSVLAALFLVNPLGWNRSAEPQAGGDRKGMP